MEEWSKTAFVVLCLAVVCLANENNVCRSNATVAKCKTLMDDQKRATANKLLLVVEDIENHFERSDLWNENAPTCKDTFVPPESAKKKIVMCSAMDAKGYMSSSLDFTLCTHAVISVANIASPSAQKNIYNIAKNIFYKQEHVVVLVELGLGYYMKDANYLEMLINAKVEGLLLTHKDTIFSESDAIKKFENIIRNLNSLLKPANKLLFVQLPIAQNEIILDFGYAELDEFVDHWILPSYWIDVNMGRTTISEPVETLVEYLLFASRWVPISKVILERSMAFDSKQLRGTKTGINAICWHFTDQGFSSYQLLNRKMLSFEQVCDEINDNKLRVRVVYNETGYLNVYAIKDREWVSFDSPSILRQKMKVVRLFNLAGVYITSADSDDFKKACKCGVQFPLLRTINEELRAGGRCKVTGCIVD